MEQPILSIYMTTYNHEKYIAEALDSILMQQTDYPYEVLIGDDASPDGTAAVLRAYEAKYPGVFQVFYHPVNLVSQDKSNATFLRDRCRGKYVVALEGDDFWTDPHKIDTQIRFLESHPEYIAVAHRCMVVDENSRPTGEYYPQCVDAEYTFDHYAADVMPGQLATVMYRNYMLDTRIDTSVVRHRLSPTDRYIYFMLLSYGRIACLPEIMSAYRHVIRNGQSYSATVRYSFAKWEKWHGILLDYAYSVGNPAAVACAETVCLSMLYESLGQSEQPPVSRPARVRRAFSFYTRRIRHPLRSVGRYLRFRFRRKFVKSSVSYRYKVRYYESRKDAAAV